VNVKKSIEQVVMEYVWEGRRTSFREMLKYGVSGNALLLAMPKEETKHE
jgi:hypothetical protein